MRISTTNFDEKQSCQQQTKNQNYLIYCRIFLNENSGTLVYKLTGYLNYDSGFMPRQSRINAQGAFHHIIARGIEGKKIFTDGVDRDKIDFEISLRKPATNLKRDTFRHFGSTQVVRFRVSRLLTKNPKPKTLNREL